MKRERIEVVVCRRGSERAYGKKLPPGKLIAVFVRERPSSGDWWEIRRHLWPDGMLSSLYVDYRWNGRGKWEEYAEMISVLDRWLPTAESRIYGWLEIES